MHGPPHAESKEMRSGNPTLPLPSTSPGQDGPASLHVRRLNSSTADSTIDPPSISALMNLIWNDLVLGTKSEIKNSLKNHPPLASSESPWTTSKSTQLAPPFEEHCTRKGSSSGAAPPGGELWCHRQYETTVEGSLASKIGEVKMVSPPSTSLLQDAAELSVKKQAAVPLGVLVGLPRLHAVIGSPRVHSPSVALPLTVQPSFVSKSSEKRNDSPKPENCVSGEGAEV